MDDMLPILDGSVLNCLFQPRYMSFDLCARLEPTSVLFAKKADQFYLQLQQLNVKEFVSRGKNVNWSRKIFSRCPNLKTVDNVPVVKESLKQDMISIQLISMMNSISSVSVEFKHFSPLAMLPMTGMASLNHLSISARYVLSGDLSFDLVPREKLRVTSLVCNAQHLMDLCNPNHLKVLRLELIVVDINELSEKLLNFKNLNEFTVRCPQNSDELLPLVTFVSNVLNLDIFSIELFTFLSETQLLDICEDAAFQKCVTHLWLLNISSECVPNILQFSKLRYLYLKGVSFSLDVFLKSLPNLQTLKAECSFNIESAQGGAVLRLTSTFDKKYIVFNNQVELL